MVPTPALAPIATPGSSKLPAEFRDFLGNVCKSALRAWIRHFDTDNDQRVSSHEFTRTCRSLGYTGDIAALISALDIDHSGEVSFAEIEPEQSELWRRFRVFCTSSFEGSEDMMHKLGCKQSAVYEARLQLDEFVSGLKANSWDGGFEELLFHAMDADGYDEPAGISMRNLKWLDVEKRRQQRKTKAFQRAQAHKKRKVDQAAVKAVVKRFKRYLKSSYGGYIRAWRRALSPTDVMVLQKTQFFSACSELGWNNEARLLWRGFGKDDIGRLSVDELDARSTETLAHFKVFVEEKFGNAANAFHALDTSKIKKVRMKEFMAAVKEFGFQRPSKVLFHGLDKDGKKFLVEEDLLFLDRWKPLAFLLASPNPHAMESVKMLLLDQYKHFLKAWRRILDVDNSNLCNWKEFEAACKTIGFKGDAPGAWRALNRHLTGHISLAEIDPSSSELLHSFRQWAVNEFGTVGSAFQVFDNDNSNSLTAIEFKRSCRIYGYEGNAHLLFRALDVERDGVVSINEVAFLDNWEEAPDDFNSPPISPRRTSPPEMIKRTRTNDSNLSDDLRDGSAPLQKKKGSKLLARLRTSLKSMVESDAPHTPGEVNVLVELTPEVLEAHSSKKPLEPHPPPSLGEACKSKPIRRVPRCPKEPERTWWNDIPLRLPHTPETDKVQNTPMWCSICKYRGYCRHMSAGPRRGGGKGPLLHSPLSRRKIGMLMRPATTSPSFEDANSRLFASPSLEDGSSREAGVPRPTGASSSMGVPSWAWGPQRYLYSTSEISKQVGQNASKDRMGSSVGSSPEMAMEVQYMALCHYPIGSVTPDQASRSLQSALALHQQSQQSEDLSLREFP